MMWYGCVKQRTDQKGIEHSVDFNVKAMVLLCLRSLILRIPIVNSKPLAAPSAPWRVSMISPIPGACFTASIHDKQRKWQHAATVVKLIMYGLARHSTHSDFDTGPVPHHMRKSGWRRSVHRVVSNLLSTPGTVSKSCNWRKISAPSDDMQIE